MAASTEALTKSAKKRMAQKAKAATAAEAAEAEAAVEAAPPVPEPKAKGKAKAKPEAKAEAAPKAAAKAAAAAPKAAAEPEKPAAKGKAKAKADAKAEPKAAAKAAAKAEPAKEEASAEPKAKAKASGKKAKAAAQPAEAVAPPVKKDDLPINTFLDDGTGGEWETPAANKKEKKEKKKVQDEAAGVDVKAAPSRSAAPARYGAPAVPEDRDARRAKVRENAEAEVARILAMKSEDPQLPVATAFCDSIIVPEPRIGIVIGPKGQTIQLIQETSKCNRIDTAGGVFTISGEEDAVKAAKGYIKDVIDKGYCTLYYEDFAEGTVNVHPQYFPDIIGSRGSIINEIKKQLKVEISMPTLPAERKDAQKFPVKIAGSSKQVEEAKECIENIMKYQHSEITHPGQTHAELEVEDWTYSFIIGRAGSELKHIQKNWEVRVNIPREHSANQNVLVVGLPEPVERAKAYIEKLITNAEEIRANPRERPEKKEEKEDKWVDKDDIVEPGLEGYIYKR